MKRSRNESIGAKLCASAKRRGQKGDSTAFVTWTGDLLEAKSAVGRFKDELERGA